MPPQFIPIEYAILGASILLILSVISSKASGRLGVPSLLLFLLIGMLAGSEGPGGIYFDDAWIAQSVGIVALIFILYSGGMDTKWKDIQPVLWKGLALSTVGVMLTALIVGWFASLLLEISLLEGLLLGAIVSSTDAAAVFAILRSRKVSLKGHLKPLLELESGSNDPMAIFLTVSLIGLLTIPGSSAVDLLPAFAQQMALGALAGYFAGKGAVILINRIKLEYEGLYPVLTISLVLMTYGLVASLGGNGFLAVYMAGISMGNSVMVHNRNVSRFHDGLAWLMQIAMFLTLGLLVFPSRLVPIAATGLLISFVLIFIARPASVFLILAPIKMPIREQVMIAWVGLRGAAPIILATFPLLAEVPRADIIFNIVFFVVLTSILVQGTSIPLAARLLKVDAPLATVEPGYLIECEPGGRIMDEMTELKIPDGSPAVGKSIADLSLPGGVLIVMLKRGDEVILPSGETSLEAGDLLYILSGKASLEELESSLQASPKEQVDLP